MHIQYEEVEVTSQIFPGEQRRIEIEMQEEEEGKQGGRSVVQQINFISGQRTPPQTEKKVQDNKRG